MRFLIINRRHNFARDQIGCAYLQGDDPLTASRYEIFLRQYFGKKLLALKFKLRRHESEPLQLGRENSFAPLCPVIPSEAEGSRGGYGKAFAAGSTGSAWHDCFVASRANDFGPYLERRPSPSQRFLNHSGLR